EQNIDILGPWPGNSPDLNPIENFFCVILNFWPRLYGDKWCVIDEAAVIFCIKIIDVDHPKLKPDKMALFNSLEELYIHVLNREKQRHTNAQLEFISQPVHLSTFLTVDHPKVRNMTTEMEDDEEIMLPDNWVLKLNTESLHLFENHSIDEELPPIKQGGMITDRRSTFQPQLPTVVKPRQLLSERDKPSTTCLPCYCLYCRTYCEDKQSFLQDREDDGDTAAGGQLLHLLQVLFSVRWLSRWYGGILLGPDHFKHINNSARNILVQEGYTSSAVRPSLPISNVSKFGTSPH
uniref:Impact N-terminal domain-containing protein n=1 Tax=Oncorhynchus kisutch TaxID=8019 RepID=A0A8C7FUY2_ONCKI